MALITELHRIPDYGGDYSCVDNDIADEQIKRGNYIEKVTLLNAIEINEVLDSQRLSEDNDRIEYHQLEYILCELEILLAKASSCLTGCHTFDDKKLMQEIKQIIDTYKLFENLVKDRRSTLRIKYRKTWEKEEPETLPIAVDIKFKTDNRGSRGQCYSFGAIKDLSIIGTNFEVESINGKGLYNLNDVESITLTGKEEQNAKET